MKKHLSIIILIIVGLITSVLLVTLFKAVQRAEPVSYKPAVEVSESPKMEIPEEYAGVGRIMAIDEKITVKGQEFDKNTVVDELRTKIRNNEPLTMSFDGSITDVSKIDALFANHLEKCGGLILENYVGSFPPTMEDIFSILEIGC